MYWSDFPKYAFYVVASVLLAAILLMSAVLINEVEREKSANYEEMASDYVVMVTDEYVVDILSKEKVSGYIMVLIVRTNEGNIYNVQCKTYYHVCYSIDKVK